MEAQSATVLGLVLDFIDQHVTPVIPLSTAEEQQLTETLSEIRSSLGTIDALVERRMQQLRPALAMAVKSWCPDCGQPAVLLDSDAAPHPVNIPAHDNPRCAFCTRRWTTVEAYVKDFTEIHLGFSWHEAVHDGADEPTENCPECGAGLVVWFDPRTGDCGIRTEYARCFGCGEEFDDVCIRCGEAVVSIERGGTVCGNCAQARN